MPPRLPLLIWLYVTGRLRDVRLAPGDRIESGTEQLFIVKRGKGQLMREGPGGHEILLRILGPGQVVQDSGTVVAETPLELLALPRSAFQ